MLCQGKSWLIYSAIRYLNKSSKIYASHYDILGVTPKATQNDIKSAYYKLSKLYHPDISSDETSAKNFRAITEAYEVLGNLKLKKMYDKGLLVGRLNTSRMEYRPDPEPTDPTLKFYKSRIQRHVAPTMDGKTPIYDFDAWSKNHYGDLFQKSQYEKDVLRKQKAKQKDSKNSNNQEAIMYVICALGGLFLVLVANGTADHDKVKDFKRDSNKSNES